MNTPTPPPVDPGQGVSDTVARLGLAQGQIVQEFGYDDDVDNDLRFAIEDVIGAEIEDEDYTGGADAALLWWREGDGDLTDALVDMVGVLEEGGFVVLLTPRQGEGGEVDPADIDEASATSGLHSAGVLHAAPLWRASKLVAPKMGARRS